MSELPIACELGPAELAARRESLLARLAARALGVERLDSGLRLHLPGDAESSELVFETVAAERRCCRFLVFELAFAPDLGPITLEITGPAGTREFLESILPLDGPERARERS
jgi:hypothetical protein